MITYSPGPSNPFNPSNLKVRVKLDNRIVGAIFKVEGGFRYVPKGQLMENGGEILPTIDAVKATL